MSDRMRPVPFERLLSRVLAEYGGEGTVFGVTPFPVRNEKPFSLFGEALEAPFGPAAGPHTQMAQNIAAAYAGGARYFELKTVQTIDGEDLHVEKPCISAAAECYNVEWSTELRVSEAFAEYVKAWFLLKLIAKEFGLGSPRGFVFNMSVGYDFAGIRSEKLDRFIEGLKNAGNTEIFSKCRKTALRFLPRFSRVTRADVEAVSPRVCASVTLSTLHGCPPEEIERIAAYLMEEKGLHTLVKCNPTLLGYDFVRRTMDALGYGFLSFGDRHFREDMQFADAVPMFRRLTERARACGVSFGVKLTNTLPVEIRRGELPGKEMYLSGRALYPLAVSLAQKLAHAFDGQLRISFSGGADAENIAALIGEGILPVTAATALLRPGGYRRLRPMAKAVVGCGAPERSGVDLKKLDAAAADALQNPRYRGSGADGAERKRPAPAGTERIPCITVCGTCADVCPNRANLPVRAGDARLLLHCDALCNECGLCTTFCPYGYVPYREKFTLFSAREDFERSQNPGFLLLSAEGRRFLVRCAGRTREVRAGEESGLPPELQPLMEWLLTRRTYLFPAEPSN